MNNSNSSTVFSRFMVLSLLISLLSVQSMFAFAISGKGVASGEISVSGPRESGEKPSVAVNGERAFSGRTFFSNGTIASNETSSATVSLGTLGRINLAPASSLSLNFSEGRIVGTLARGTISVANMDGVAVTIDTPNDSVTNEGNASSRFTVAVLGDRTGVSVERGTVRSRDGAVVSKKDDDDDDDDSWRPWATVAVIGGIIATAVVIIALSDDDEDTVSPVR